MWCIWQFIYINVQTTKSVNCSRKCPYTSNWGFYGKQTPPPNLLKIPVLVHSFWFWHPFCLEISSNTPRGVWIFSRTTQCTNILRYQLFCSQRSTIPWSRLILPTDLFNIFKLVTWQNKHMTDFRTHETLSMWLSHEYMNCLWNPNNISARGKAGLCAHFQSTWEPITA